MIPVPRSVETALEGLGRPPTGLASLVQTGLRAGRSQHLLAEERPELTCRARLVLGRPGWGTSRTPGTWRCIESSLATQACVPAFKEKLICN